MLRAIVTAGLLSATAATAHAEVWMVKGVNVLACQDRQTLVELDASPIPTRSSAAPKGCIVLYSGERLLEQPQLGQGFNKYIMAEREDGSILFVRNSDVVADPGIGSVSEDRADR